MRNGGLIEQAIPEKVTPNGYPKDEQQLAREMVLRLLIYSLTHSFLYLLNSKHVVLF